VTDNGVWYGLALRKADVVTIILYTHDIVVTFWGTGYTPTLPDGFTASSRSQKVSRVSSARPASRVLAILLLIAGFAIAMLAVFADIVGYGTGRGFGYYQMIILIGGIVTALIGVAMLVHQRTSRSTPPDFEPEP
jgi:hypothetical protein